MPCGAERDLCACSNGPWRRTAAVWQVSIHNTAPPGPDASGTATRTEDGVPNQVRAPLRRSVPGGRVRVPAAALAPLPRVIWGLEAGRWSSVRGPHWWRHRGLTTVSVLHVTGEENTRRAAGGAREGFRWYRRTVSSLLTRQRGSSPGGRGVFWSWCQHGGWGLRSRSRLVF